RHPRRSGRRQPPDRPALPRGRRPARADARPDPRPHARPLRPLCHVRRRALACRDLARPRVGPPGPVINPLAEGLMGISFFSMLTDSKMSIHEGNAINAALDRGNAALEVASAQGDAFGGAISRLQGKVVAQDREIKLLRAAIGVLAAMLRDQGVVNNDMLDLRLEAAMENAEEE